MYIANFDFDSSIHEYLIYLTSSERKSENTIKSYTSDLKDFQKFINDINKKVVDVNEVEIGEYKVSLNNKNLATSTVNRKMTAVKMLYDYLHKRGYIDRLPTLLVTSNKVTQTNPTYLSIDEVNKLINAIDDEGNNFIRTRDKAIIVLFITTGIRLSELTNIRIDDIKGSSLKVLGKGNKERTVFLSDDTKELIDNYMDNRGEVDTDYLFISTRLKKISNRTVQHIVKKYLEKASLDTNKYSTHKLRHTSATLMYQSGEDIKTIKEVLGHSDITTTDKYTHTSNKDVSRAINKVSNLIDKK